MIELLICSALIGAPVETETCTLYSTDRRIETTCAWVSAATLAKGKRRVTFCAPAKGRTKP